MTQYTLSKIRKGTWTLEWERIYVLDDDGEAKFEDSKVVQEWRQEVPACALILSLLPKLLKQYNSPCSLTVPIFLPMARSWKTQWMGKKVTKHFRSWVSFLTEIRLLERFGTWRTSLRLRDDRKETLPCPVMGIWVPLATVIWFSKIETYDVKRNEWRVIWSVAPESRTQESLHKVLETLKDALKFLPVIARELVPESDLLVDSIRDFKRSISTCSTCISEVRSSTLLTGTSILSK